MGRLNQNEARPTQHQQQQEEEPLQFQHFSHVHPLKRLVLPQPSSFLPATAAICGGCTLPSSGTAYACTPCKYVLHRSCALAPRTMPHPAHPGAGHTLELSTTTGRSSTSSCDACGKRCGSFSFSCNHGCGGGYKLHARCARLARDVRHPSHPHPLFLTYQLPYGPSQQFLCDVCRTPSGVAKWLYRCDSCGFDVHLDCGADDTGGPQRRPQQEPQADPLLTTIERSRQDSQVMVESLLAKAEAERRQSEEMLQNLLRQNQGSSLFGFPFQHVDVCSHQGSQATPELFNTHTETPSQQNEMWQNLLRPNHGGSPLGFPFQHVGSHQESQATPELFNTHAEAPGPEMWQNPLLPNQGGSSFGLPFQHVGSNPVDPSAVLPTQADQESQATPELFNARAEGQSQENQEGSPFGVPFQHVGGNPVDPSAVLPTQADSNVAAAIHAMTSMNLAAMDGLMDSHSKVMQSMFDLSMDIKF